ncbi:MAG TPA: protein translocase subunit SecD [Candidatus Saccharimonadales bacterium]|nr:protein translocase subunit SecD [Candidatus Saccharimonadales bacterium]
MKNPRLLFAFIIALTILSLLVVLPRPLPILKSDPQFFLRPLIGQKNVEFRRGLDLSGGTSITFRADMKGIKSENRQNALDSAKSVIEKRINLFGVSEPVIQTATVNNDYRIIVELPGVTDANEAINLIGKTAQLTFWEEGASQSGSLTETASSSALPAGLTQVLQNPKQTNLTGSDLQQASMTFDQNNGSPQVSLNFTPDGTQKFADITKRNANKIVAIVLDNEVIEAPRVNQPILTGNAVITGTFTQAVATALATELNAGALPVPLSVLQQQVIGPTLGIESLQKTLFAGILGFVIIVLFMCVLYRRLGIVASLALCVYTLIVLGIFKISTLTPYGITLTLSGIAGFILSIGMAVDANILIFERTKEELRRGKTKPMAIEIGFSRAWSSIRDSNISTLITSVILYEFGTGLVKGFALVLAIGVLVSMFSAIVVTRTFLRIMYRNI